MFLIFSFPGLFKFKKFSLKISEGVFPVTTDSVLLGSWVKMKNVKKILDLGCGSGILSLMLTQKSEEDTQLFAIDIDKKSIECCSGNVANSPWKEKINCFQLDVTELFTNDEFNKLKFGFDLIISNPPYFQDQLKSQEKQVARNKHQEHFDFKLLSKISNFYLNEQGKACFVIPINYEEALTFQMYLSSFQLKRIAKIKHTVDSDYSLALLEYCKVSTGLLQEEIILFDQNGKRTKEFNELTRDYYL